MKERNLDYEKKFRAYLFSGCIERHKEICKNINVRDNQKAKKVIETKEVSECCKALVEIVGVNKDHILDKDIKQFKVCSDCGQEIN